MGKRKHPYTRKEFWEKNKFWKNEMHGKHEVYEEMVSKILSSFYNKQDNIFNKN